GGRVRGECGGQWGAGGQGGGLGGAAGAYMHGGDFRRPCGREPAQCRRVARTRHSQSRRIRSGGAETRNRSRLDRFATKKARRQSRNISAVRYGSNPAPYRTRLCDDVGHRSARRVSPQLRRRCRLRCEPRNSCATGDLAQATRSLYLLPDGSTALVAPVGAAARRRRPCNSYSPSWPWRRPWCWTFAPAKLIKAHGARARVGATHLFTIAACELSTSVSRR